MPVLELCTCDDLPAHDHFMGHELIDGVLRARYDYIDVGRVSVDWRHLARAFADDNDRLRDAVLWTIRLLEGHAPDLALALGARDRDPVAAAVLQEYVEALRTVAGPPGGGPA